MFELIYLSSYTLKNSIRSLPMDPITKRTLDLSAEANYTQESFFGWN